MLDMAAVDREMSWPDTTSGPRRRRSCPPGERREGFDLETSAIRWTILPGVTVRTGMHSTARFRADPSFRPDDRVRINVTNLYARAPPSTGTA